MGGAAMGGGGGGGAAGNGPAGGAGAAGLAWRQDRSEAANSSLSMMVRRTFRVRPRLSRATLIRMTLKVLNFWQAGH